ncbi:F-box/FBD/LRR-repeat protein At5g53840 isoform X2 [Manihot esculenta]|uniref:F-box/FBD/LRR-repeat protein At5g53840 isoform X2 n=1 Tax=Manihot esculenta TaxID=3983 RepID=UPI001CC3FDF7|nr:F-box/FBD/LRR-repeat protein At5g53840 isoform X2 [Manihot esculenta]
MLANNIEEESEVNIVEKMDRISELPECIIHHIYSFLPTKDMAKTALLSKSWRSKRASYPNLDFDQSLFGEELEIPGMHRRNAKENNEQNSVRKLRKKFIQFVDGTMQRFCDQDLYIQKFKLHMKIRQSHHAYLVQEWIRLAIKRRVREVSIHILMPVFMALLLPREIFACKSITVLKLSCCDLRAISFRDTSAVMLPCLLKLSLKHVSVGEFTVQYFLLGCPSIVHLSFKNCKGFFTNLYIPGPKSLKILKLIVVKREFKQLERVDIEAPTLERLTIHGDSVMTKVAKSRELKSLTIKGGDMVTDQLFRELISEHPLLETLDLDSCKRLERINISSRRLKSLKIRNCRYLEHCEIVTPNLLSFEFDGKLSAFCSGFISAPCQWKVKLELDFDTLWLSDLEFLIKENRIKHLTLSISSDEISSYYSGHKVNPLVISPCCEVEHLSLRTDVSRSSYRAIVESLFSICQPKILSVAFRMKSTNKFIKFLYENLMDIKNPKCCRARKQKCWRHYLKDVKIERVESDKKEKPQCLACLEKMPLEWVTLLNPQPKLGGGLVYFALNWRDLPSVNHE